MAERIIKASEFKAKCLQLMDEVNETGEPIVITKNGKRVAVLRPAAPRKRSIFGLHADEIEILGDISGPVLDPFEAPF